MTLLGKLKKSNDDFSYASVYLKIHFKKIILVLQKKKRNVRGMASLKNYCKNICICLHDLKIMLLNLNFCS